MKKVINLEMSVRARWSSIIADDGYTTVPNKLIDCYDSYGISDKELVCIIQIFKYKWDIRKPYPSINTIAAKMGKDRTSVQRYLSSLEKKGFVKRIFRTGITSEYDFSPLIKMLEKDIILNRGETQKHTVPHAKVQPKEEELIIKNKEDVSLNDSADQRIKDGMAFLRQRLRNEGLNV